MRQRSNGSDRRQLRNRPGSRARRKPIRPLQHRRPAPKRRRRPKSRKSRVHPLHSKGALRTAALPITALKNYPASGLRSGQTERGSWKSIIWKKPASIISNGPGRGTRCAHRIQPILPFIPRFTMAKERMIFTEPVSRSAFPPERKTFSAKLWEVFQMESLQENLTLLPARRKVPRPPDRKRHPSPRKD